MICNPFKDAVMRRQFDACIHCYDTKHRDLIRADGGRHTGNAVANFFWQGFDGAGRDRWDAASRKMIAWACYRAGEEIRKREAKAAPVPTPTDPSPEPHGGMPFGGQSR
jgi:hypothetical protein